MRGDAEGPGERVPVDNLFDKKIHQVVFFVYGEMLVNVLEGLEIVVWDVGVQ